MPVQIESNDCSMGINNKKLFNKTREKNSIKVFDQYGLCPF